MPGKKRKNKCTWERNYLDKERINTDSQKLTFRIQLSIRKIMELQAPVPHFRCTTQCAKYPCNTVLAPTHEMWEINMCQKGRGLCWWPTLMIVSVKANRQYEVVKVWAANTVINWMWWVMYGYITTSIYYTTSGTGINTIASLIHSHSIRQNCLRKKSQERDKLVA